MSKRKTTVFVLLLAVVLLAAFAAFKLYRDRRASFPLSLSGAGGGAVG